MPIIELYPSIFSFSREEVVLGFELRALCLLGKCYTA
jgi:hypothetical protein